MDLILSIADIVKVPIIFATLIHVSSGLLPTTDKDKPVSPSVSETRLLRDLFSRYDKRVRSAVSADDTTHVSLGLTVRSLMQLDERHQFMETVSTMHMSWHDRRLRWNRAEYEYVDHVKVPANSLWRPDIVPSTSIDEDTHLNEIDAIVYTTGDVHWNPVLRLRSPCSINLERFPFDEQNCIIKFASSLYHGNHINITFYGKEESTLDIEENYPNHNWQVVNYSSRITLHNYYCCNKTYPEMEFQFLFQRKSEQYFRVLVIPALLLGALVPLSVFLSPDCKERLTVEMIVLLCLLLLLGKLYDILPMAQGEMPALAKYYLVTLVLDAVALVGSTVVLNLHNRAPRRTNVPNIIKGIFLGGLRWIACLSNGAYTPLDNLETISMRGLNPAVSHNQHSPDHQASMGASSSKLEKDLEELGKTVNALMTRFSVKDIHEEVLNEWQQVALVLDRLLFLFLSLTFFVSTVHILELA